MSRVGFILKQEHTEPQRLLAELAPWLVDQSHTLFVVDEALKSKHINVINEKQFATSIDLVVTLGGDGTILRANALVGDSGIPILGINLGRLGFLAPFDPNHARDAIEAAIKGELKLIKRMRLEVTYVPEGQDPITRSALNDVVINQTSMARMLALEARLDDDFIATYRADGLIVATPTGSTAYNLAAGGPIVYPGHKAMAITPICAHALTNRPLVVSHDQHVSISLADNDSNGLLTIDGQWAHPFSAGDKVFVTTAKTPLNVYASDKGYFDILRQKLHWGARANHS